MSDLSRTSSLSSDRASAVVPQRPGDDPGGRSPSVSVWEGWGCSSAGVAGRRPGAKGSVPGWQGRAPPSGRARSRAAGPEGGSTARRALRAAAQRARPGPSGAPAVPAPAWAEAPSDRLQAGARDQACPTRPAGLSASPPCQEQWRPLQPPHDHQSSVRSHPCHVPWAHQVHEECQEPDMPRAGAAGAAGERGPAGGAGRPPWAICTMPVPGADGSVRGPRAERCGRQTSSAA